MLHSFETYSSECSTLSEFIILPIVRVFCTTRGATQIAREHLHTGRMGGGHRHCAVASTELCVATNDALGLRTGRPHVGEVQDAHTSDARVLYPADGEWGCEREQYFIKHDIR